VLASTPS